MGEREEALFSVLAHITHLLLLWPCLVHLPRRLLCPPAWTLQQLTARKRWHNSSMKLGSIRYRIGEEEEGRKGAGSKTNTYYIPVRPFRVYDRLELVLQSTRNVAVESGDHAGPNQEVATEQTVHVEICFLSLRTVRASVFIIWVIDDIVKLKFCVRRAC